MTGCIFIAECGANFTSKMEGMLADMNISKDVIEEYTQHIESHPPPPNIGAHNMFLK